ncbi:hypothetical protein J5069_02970 [Candidatus Symbiopectobacterium sp. NZEC127]|uniref:hypothetical protein n=1 Tax=Candidatus Symbiopectobacterium sp. NZEC127 TaxID=2820472 RepID=UPI0022280AF2|nr:hypothetical protein [Candidatus Symbiopectobacterium sp. NZEC127]MCW2484853.1 hypothetical protein [Candidatus Symbiopectobacterium sp. NZEC127]
MNLGAEMALSSLHGLLDLLTNVDNDVNPETIRRTALLGLMLVSELEDGFQNNQSGNVLPLTMLKRLVGKPSSEAVRLRSNCGNVLRPHLRIRRITLEIDSVVTK